MLIVQCQSGCSLVAIAQVDGRSWVEESSGVGD